MELTWPSSWQRILHGLNGSGQFIVVDVGLVDQFVVRGVKMVKNALSSHRPEPCRGAYSSSHDLPAGLRGRGKGRDGKERKNRGGDGETERRREVPPVTAPSSASVSS